MTPGISPMRARSGPVPQDPGWVFEFTWDGVRSLADVEPSGVCLVGGSGRAISTSYPELDGLPALTRRRRILLDGKIVALDACGRPSFSCLQQRMNLQRPSSTVLRRIPVAFYVFDLLRLDGHPTLELPYQRRRELLEELDLTGGPLVVPPCFPDTDGHAVLRTAAEYDLGGVVAKRADSGYQPGRRSRNWVATALRHTQEVVVGGWLPGRTETATPGSLLVGVPTDRGLRYVGQVGTGFSAAERRELRECLTGMARPTSPFLQGGPQPCDRHVNWVAPELLGEVSYRQWTAHGRLGHPTWRGLRRGKHPAAVQGPVVLHAAPRRENPDERELLHEAVRRARAEVNAPRAQVNPHFLYNALTTIAALIRTDPRRARELLTEFAGFTRYTFRSSELTTLGDELENVERYLTLEQARLDERIQVTLHADTAVLPVALPFLALQAVVGNAVVGIEDEPGGGTVSISAVAAERDCVITVSDDGPGNETDLRDVDEQLRATFGERYRLLVDSRAGIGTTVSLRVPKAG